MRPFTPYDVIIGILFGALVIVAFLMLPIATDGERADTHPTPTPQETPWMWIHNASGGACYVYKDQIGVPCFSWPRATP